MDSTENYDKLIDGKFIFYKNKTPYSEEFFKVLQQPINTGNYLFNSEADSLWQQVMKNKGDRYEVIADMSDGVNWN